MGEIFNLIESVSEGFPSYFFKMLSEAFCMELTILRFKMYYSETGTRSNYI